MQSVIVVPCYNEAERLDRSEWARLASAPDVRVIFVDDGSTDRTATVLEEMCQSMQRAQTLRLDRNGGKAEAVRAGMLRGVADGAELVGYLDADLATPVEEMLRLVGEIEGRGAAAVTGARVALAGHEIDRSLTRHYIGRIFATLAALILRQPFYDTQCGAKLFRNTPLLAHALAVPFRSPWAFDVELLGRLRIGAPGTPGVAKTELVEIPLRRWTDVRGSKVSVLHMLRTLAELWAIERDLRARRALVRGAK
jgi:dolichyl-phosphate beta-glucosyltransferase